jgi:hypothetical protein
LVGVRVAGDDPGDVSGGDHPALFDRVQAHHGGAVPAVAAPVHTGFFDAHLGEGVFDVDVPTGGAVQDYRFAGSGGRAAHAVNLARIGAAEQPRQQHIEAGAALPEVLRFEHPALAGASTHPFRFDLHRLPPLLRPNNFWGPEKRLSQITL